MQVMFGSGVAWARPLTDASGNTITNPTPVNFAGLQEISVGIEFPTKSLLAQYQFPIAVGRGAGKITGKAKTGIVNGAMYNNIFFGLTLSNGIYTNVFDTTGTAMPTTPFQVTVAPPNSGTFGYDLGVRDAGGVPYTRAATATTAYLYQLSGAVYTFSGAASEVGKTVYISYNYTATGAASPPKQTKIAITNQLLGYQPTFALDMIIPYNNKVLTLTLNSCIAGKLSLQTKLDDFTIPEWDFDAFADNNNQIGTWSLSE